MVLVKVIKRVRRRLAHTVWWLETVTMLAISRLLIKYVPFRFWKKLLGAINQAEPWTIDNLPNSEAKAITVGRWVRRTARSMPFEAVCLPQAMAGRWMLKRRRLDSRMYFGARYNSDLQSSEFHAWLMYGDLCLTGRFEKDQYEVFSDGREIDGQRSVE